MHWPRRRCYLQPNSDHTWSTSFSQLSHRSLPCILFKGGCLLCLLSEWRNTNTFWTLDRLLVNPRDDRKSQIRSRLHQKIRPSVDYCLELGCGLLHFHHYCADLRSNQLKKSGRGGSRHACLHSNLQHFALSWLEDNQFMTGMDIYETRVFINLLNTSNDLRIYEHIKR